MHSIVNLINIVDARKGGTLTVTHRIWRERGEPVAPAIRKLSALTGRTVCNRSN